MSPTKVFLFTLISISNHFFQIKSVNAQQNERTLLMLKPDAVQRNLIGEIITRFEKRGFQLVAMKLAQANEQRARDHYWDHENSTFIDDLLKYIQSGPVVPMVWEGENIIQLTREMIGGHPQRPLPGMLGASMLFATPGTIRGDYAINVRRNIIHASDSIEAAEREIKVWFSEDEILKWNSTLIGWI